MNQEQALQQLHNEYSKFDWYDSVGVDKYGRYVVYVHFITLAVMNAVRHELNDTQVLIAFVHAKPALNKKNRYINYADLGKIKTSTSEEDCLDLDYLISTLDRLEKFCGSQILGDIFFESHDQEHAVSNYSKKYPEVRQSIDKLYSEYGFDIIYEELEL